VPAFRRPILSAILARPEIAAGYREAAAFTAPDYGGGTVRIYRRARRLPLRPGFLVKCRALPKPHERARGLRPCRKNC
jgi:hypothetical protein